MTKEQRELQWTKMYLRLTIWEKVSRSILLFFIVLLNGAVIYREVYIEDNFGIGLITFEIVSLVISILFVIWLKRSRRFQFIDTNLNEADFKKLVRATANDLGWNIEELKYSHAVCNQGHNWHKFGLRITILRKSNSVAFNSIVEPIGTHPFTGGVNKRNLRVFKQNLLDLRNGIEIIARSKDRLKQRELNYLNENERSFKNTIRRTVFYTISFSFLIFGLIMVFKGHGVGVLLMAFSIPYFFLDFKALTEKIRLLKKILKTDTDRKHP